MITTVVTLFNKNTGHYSYPLIMENKEQAKSHFINEIQMPDSEMANIKDSLELYAVGTFDHKTGEIKGYYFKKSELLIKGSEVQLTQKGE